MMFGSIAFIGLGKMGYPMSQRLINYKQLPLRVWTRSQEKLSHHAKHLGSIPCVDLKETINTMKPSIIFTSLPSSNEVIQVYNQLQDHLIPNSIWIDCTTGNPEDAKILFSKLKEKKCSFLDAPVSGGPQKAITGELTMMIGGEEEVISTTKFLLDLIAKKIVHIGESGSGQMVKCINNLLGIAHFVIGCEGMLALSKQGISLEKALEVINSSSGRSLMTMDRIPNQVISRNFNYGGSLGMWIKDGILGSEILKTSLTQGSEKNLDLTNDIVLLKAIERAKQALTTFGDDVDETFIAKYFEEIYHKKIE